MIVIWFWPVSDIVLFRLSCAPWAPCWATATTTAATGRTRRRQGAGSSITLSRRLATGRSATRCTSLTARRCTGTTVRMLSSTERSASASLITSTLTPIKLTWATTSWPASVTRCLNTTRSVTRCPRRSAGITPDRSAGRCQSACPELLLVGSVTDTELSREQTFNKHLALNLSLCPALNCRIDTPSTYSLAHQKNVSR